MAELTRDIKMLAGAFITSGTVHLVKPEVFEPLMPSWVPAHREVIVYSGYAELACAAGLLHPKTRRNAGWASAALLAIVYVGNLKMADDAHRSDKPAFKAAAYGRLPLQFLGFRAAYRATR